MATVGNSIYDIRGKLGDLVYYRYRGKSLVRKVSKRKRNNPTQSQLEHQAKFLMMANFLRPLYDFLKITYKVYNRNKTGYQKAFSENYRAALTGTHPSLSIDYTKVRLANGTLPNLVDPSIHSSEPGKLILSWSETEGWGSSMSSDKLYIAIYSEKLNRWIYRFSCAERYKRICRVDVSAFTGTRVQVWLGFVSADGKRVSDSLHAGELMVS